MPLLDTPLPSSPKQRRFWITPDGSASALAIAEAARRHDGLLVVVARDNLRARQWEDELAVFADDLPVLHFPDWETLPYDLFSPHPEIVSQRISTLYRLSGVRRGILIVPVGTLMQRLAPRSYITGSGLSVRQGQTLDLDAEQRRLEAAGYRHVPQAGDPGEFAVRGALIDIFAMGAPQPYRIELFDDEVDSIRSFDPETQRSADKVEAVELLPAREFPLTDEAKRDFRNRLRERFPIDVRRCPLYQDMKQGMTPGGIEYYLPLFFEATETLFDYLDPSAMLLLDENALDAAEQAWQQAGSRYEQRAHDVERPILPPDELYLAPDKLREQLNAWRRAEFVAADHDHAKPLGTTPVPDITLPPRSEAGAPALTQFLDDYNGRVLVATDTAGRREAVYDLLAAHGVRSAPIDDWRSFIDGDTPDAPIALTVAPLERGFLLDANDLAILTERELLGERAPQTRRRKGQTKARDPDTIIRDLNELEEGAPIVHIDHGVGRYRGLQPLDVGDTDGEYLVIEYAKGDKLYVPVAQLDLVSRYTGTSPETAPLHSLGGEAWSKARRKAAEKVHDVAAELLAIYAQREARKGTATTIDHALCRQFAAGFPFEETPDQEQAIAAVLDDLEAPRAMDRVVCGDVGFGKTEVALRAAFAVASAGRQVCVLVPTTLLAQQHYTNFTDRFADWPLTVEVLSRFQSRKDTTQALSNLAEGKLDVVIGTHKLLGNDVKFKDLGLVIVDEEQRFGVRQKEKLKKLRAEVDLLTLTATPIPRTLNMAMSGLRDLSLIATPPAHRMAVNTTITQYNPALVREALQRELARGGQVYFMHNEVNSIERCARELEELMPDARIRVAHGQMPERELEQVMLDFHRQRFNVLVCTTIIESGIDIPTANTIVIDRADRFGLAQLHQLRGRVGRSRHRAYAYLIVPDKRAMTSDARKRLEALASLEELGAGFTLATHDLEIRGAGELLGDEQSGQIQQVGFGLYNELLERAVNALKSGKVPDFDLTSDHETEVVLHAPALIPEDYLPDVHTRLTLYKRIASARDEDALRDLKVEMIDRFGMLPDPIKQLFAITELKLKATPMGIRKLEFGPAGGRIMFREQPAINPRALIGLIQDQPRIYKLEGQEKLRIQREFETPPERLEAAHQLLATLYV
ncbi:MAG TPA: transcription-repair coupling factor [Oleiagrimonas sp.]|nr:transcription-repair coupling factor [Oleiagrimonas sp.]